MANDKQKINFDGWSIYNWTKSVLDKIEEDYAHDTNLGRLYYCKAEIHETSEYVYLVSYSTIVAAYFKKRQ